MHRIGGKIAFLAIFDEIDQSGMRPGGLADDPRYGGKLFARA